MEELLEADAKTTVLIHQIDHMITTPDAPTYLQYAQ